MIKIKFTFLLLLLCGITAFAQEIITDRPDQTESSSTVAKGSIQIESGIQVEYIGDDGYNSFGLVAPTTLFRVGLFDGLELRMVNQLEYIKLLGDDKSFSGISDLQIGTKVQLFKKEEVNTEIAFLSHLILPTGSKLLSLDKFGMVNKLSIAHSLGENLNLGYNIGYDFFDIEKGSMTYSVALGIGLTDKIGVYIEPYGEWVDFDDYVSNFDAGFTYLLKENLQFDFSFGTGLNHDMNYIAVGMSWYVVPAE